MTTSREAGAAPGLRRDLTHVPFYSGELPPIDVDRCYWPGRTMRAGGVSLHVRTVDGPGPDAPTAVYVHGLGGSSTNWTDLAGLLSARMGGLIVDLPGFGRSDPPPRYDYTMDSHAEVVSRFIAGLGKAPVHLFGNSMGGAITMMIAASRPELVRSLTLISPAVPDLRPYPSRAADPRMPLAILPVIGAGARRALAALTPRERAERVLRLCFAHPEEIAPQRIAAAEAEVAERLTMPWARAALDRSTIGLLRSWLVRKPRSLWAVAGKISAPTLVVWGAKDRLVSVRKAPRTAAAIPGARLLILPDTGHVAQMERPESVARAVLGMHDAIECHQW